MFYYLFYPLRDIFFGFNVSDSAISFFNNKSSNYGEDLISTRFYLINIDPIINNFEKFNILQILIGDGVSIQHSFLSHTLIVTGLLGFMIFIKKYYLIIKDSFRLIKKGVSNNISKFLILTILIVLINDFITNVSFFLPFAGYLSAIIIAFFQGELNKKSYD